MFPLKNDKGGTGYTPPTFTPQKINYTPPAEQVVVDYTGAGKKSPGNELAPWDIAIEKKRKIEQEYKALEDQFKEMKSSRSGGLSTSEAESWKLKLDELKGSLVSAQAEEKKVRQGLQKYINSFYEEVGISNPNDKSFVIKDKFGNEIPDEGLIMKKATEYARAHGGGGNLATALAADMIRATRQNIIQPAFEKEFKRLQGEYEAIPGWGELNKEYKSRIAYGSSKQPEQEKAVLKISSHINDGAKAMQSVAETQFRSFVQAKKDEYKPVVESMVNKYSKFKSEIHAGMVQELQSEVQHSIDVFRSELEEQVKAGQIALGPANFRMKKFAEDAYSSLKASLESKDFSNKVDSAFNDIYGPEMRQELESIDEKFRQEVGAKKSKLDGVLRRGIQELNSIGDDAIKKIGSSVDPAMMEIANKAYMNALADQDRKMGKQVENSYRSSVKGGSSLFDNKILGGLSSFVNTFSSDDVLKDIGSWFGDSFFANAGNMMRSKAMALEAAGLDGPFIDWLKERGSSLYSANATYTPELKAWNFMSPAFIGNSMGQIAYSVPSIAASAVLSRVGLPVGAANLYALFQTADNAAVNSGDTYWQWMQQNPGDFTGAQNAAKKVFMLHMLDMPLNAVVGKFWFGKNPTFASLGQAMTSEYATESYESATQSAVVNPMTKNLIKDSWNYWKGKQAQTEGVMAGFGVLTTGGASMMHSAAADAVFGKAKPDAQFLASIIFDRTSDFAKASFVGLEAEYGREKMEWINSTIDRLGDAVADAKALGLPKDKALLYVEVTERINDEKAKAELVKNPVMKEQILAYAKEMEKDLMKIVDGSLEPVTIRVAGTTIAMKPEDAEQFLEDPAVQATVADGSLKIQSNDEKVNKKVEEAVVNSMAPTEEGDIAITENQKPNETAERRRETGRGQDVSSLRQGQEKGQEDVLTSKKETGSQTDTVPASIQTATPVSDEQKTADRKAFNQKFGEDMKMSASLTPEGRRKKFDAMTKRLITAKNDGIIDDNDFNTKYSDISKAYQKLAESNPEYREAAKAAANRIKETVDSTRVDVSSFAKGEKISVTVDNVDNLDENAFTGTGRKVVKDVKNVAKAIGRLVKSSTGSGLTVSLHKDDASFGEAVIAAGGSQQDAAAKGFYLGSDGSIHLNMARATSETMLHEGFHPVLDYIEKRDPSKIDALYNQLATSSEGRKFIADNKEMYSGETTQKKEAITDFVAHVADGRVIVNASNFQRVKNMILGWLKKLGFDVTVKRIADMKDAKDLKDLAQFITEKFTKGEEIATQSTLNPAFTPDIQFARENVSVFSAPYYDLSLRGQVSVTEGAKSARDTEEYRQYESDIQDLAQMMGVTLDGIERSIGGFENESGNKIIGVSTKTNVVVDDFQKVIEYAAVIGALAPNVQESTIAARYVQPGSDGHNADEYIIKVSDVDKTIQALTELGVYNFSVNETTKELTLLNIFAFPTENIRDIIINLASELEEYGVEHSEATKSAIQSEYIGYSERQDIMGSISGNAVYRQIGQRFRDVIERAKARNEEFIRSKDGGVSPQFSRLAPNGRPSNLNEFQYNQVRTPEFKAWFGDWENDPENASKVVDENGEPRVVYHGTNSKFEEFAGDINFFATILSFSRDYGRNILEVFLNIRKPFNLSNEGDFNKLIDLAGSLEDPYDNNEYNNFSDYMRSGASEDTWWIAENYYDLIYSLGYDGLFIKEGGYSNIATFYPNQTKSATNNAGAFSINDNRIQFSRERQPMTFRQLFAKIYRQEKNALNAVRQMQQEVAKYFQANGIALDPDLITEVIDQVANLAKPDITIEDIDQVLGAIDDAIKIQTNINYRKAKESFGQQLINMALAMEDLANTIKTIQKAVVDYFKTNGLDIRKSGVVNVLKQLTRLAEAGESSDTLFDVLNSIDAIIAEQQKYNEIQDAKKALAKFKKFVKGSKYLSIDHRSRIAEILSKAKALNPNLMAQVGVDMKEFSDTLKTIMSEYGGSQVVRDLRTTNLKYMSSKLDAIAKDISDYLDAKDLLRYNAEMNAAQSRYDRAMKKYQAGGAKLASMGGSMALPQQIPPFFFPAYDEWREAREDADLFAEMQSKIENAGNKGASSDKIKAVAKLQIERLKQHVSDNASSLDDFFKSLANRIGAMDLTLTRDEDAKMLVALINNMINDGNTQGVMRFLAYQDAKEEAKGIAENPMRIRGGWANSARTFSGLLQSLAFNDKDAARLRKMFLDVMSAANTVQRMMYGFVKQDGPGVIDQVYAIAKKMQDKPLSNTRVGVFQFLNQAAERPVTDRNQFTPGQIEQRVGMQDFLTPDGMVSKQADFEARLAHIIEATVIRQFNEASANRRGGGVTAVSMEKNAMDTADALKQMGLISGYTVNQDQFGNRTMEVQRKDGVSLDGLYDQLDANEKELYEYIREKFADADFLEAMKQVSESLYNLPFNPIANYAPMVAKRFKNPRATGAEQIAEIGDMKLGGDGPRRVKTRPSDRFMQRGVLANSSEFYYSTDAISNFLSAFYEANLAIEGGESLKSLAYLMNTTEFQDLLNGVFNKQLEGTDIRYQMDDQNKSQYNTLLERFAEILRDTVYPPYLSKDPRGWFSKTFEYILGGVTATYLQTSDQVLKQLLPNVASGIVASGMPQTLQAIRVLFHYSHAASPEERSKFVEFMKNFEGDFRSPMGEAAFDELNQLMNDYGKIYKTALAATRFKDMYTPARIGKYIFKTSDKAAYAINAIAAYIDAEVRSGRLESAWDFDIDAMENVDQESVANALNIAELLNNSSKPAERAPYTRMGRQDKDIKDTFLRNLMFLKGFSLNSFMGFQNNMRIATSHRATTNEKLLAASRAGSYAVQIGVFNLIKTFVISEGFNILGAVLVKNLFGLEGAAESEEQKKKRRAKKAAQFLANTTADALVGFLPSPVEAGLKKAANWMWGVDKQPMFNFLKDNPSIAEAIIGTTIPSYLKFEDKAAKKILKGTILDSRYNPYFDPGGGAGGSAQVYADLASTFLEAFKTRTNKMYTEEQNAALDKMDIAAAVAMITGQGDAMKVIYGMEREIRRQGENNPKKSKSSSTINSLQSDLKKAMRLNSGLKLNKL